jgi:penicillin-binding protein 2
MRLGVDKINKWASLMGLGRKTGIDLPNETPGYIPAADLKLRWRKKDEDPNHPKFRWNDGDTVNAAIGQGYDRPTPLQMVHGFAGVAMDGQFMTPHLLRHARSNGVRPDRDFEDRNRVDIPLDPTAYTNVMNGMRQVVTNGTARRAEVPGFDVCGKTGTAQVASIRTGASGKLKEHAWFVGFAPKPDTETGRLPEIAVCVLVEHGGHGGVESAPIAQAIIAEYVRKYHPELAADAESADQNAATPSDPDAVSLVDDAAADGLEPAPVAGTESDAAPAPTIVPTLESAASTADEVGGQPALPAPTAPQVHPLQGILRGTRQDAIPPPRRPARAAGGQ